MYASCMGRFTARQISSVSNKNLLIRKTHPAPDYTPPLSQGGYFRPPPDRERPPFSSSPRQGKATLLLLPPTGRGHPSPPPPDRERPPFFPPPLGGGRRGGGWNANAPPRQDSATPPLPREQAPRSIDPSFDRPVIPAKAGICLNDLRLPAFRGCEGILAFVRDGIFPPVRCVGRAVSAGLGAAGMRAGRLCPIPRDARSNRAMGDFLTSGAPRRARMLGGAERDSLRRKSNGIPQDAGRTPDSAGGSGGSRQVTQRRVRARPAAPPPGR